jgi:hypothetical protein
MENDSKTGTCGSRYISSGSYTYTIDMPDPPIIFIELSPDIPQPGIQLERKIKTIFFHLSVIKQI